MQINRSPSVHRKSYRFAEFGCCVMMEKIEPALIDTQYTSNKVIAPAREDPLI